MTAARPTVAVGIPETKKPPRSTRGGFAVDERI
jgi:hypothetical protein